MVTVRQAVVGSGGPATACTRVPPAASDVCRCCHGRTRVGYPLCFPCGSVLRQVSEPCDRVVPVSLYRRGGHLHTVLRRYKDDPDPRRRRLLAGQVAALLARFLWRHGPCVAPGGWDFLAVVPSTTGRPGRHPLERALGEVPWLAAQLLPALTPTGAPVDHNAPDETAFTVGSAGDGDGPPGPTGPGPLSGSRAVLLDDTYTTGARAQSAASALSLAGVDVTAVVPVGRVISPAAAPTVARWWSLRQQRWDADRCCLEQCTGLVWPGGPAARSGRDGQLADADRRVPVPQVGDPQQQVAG